MNRSLFRRSMLLLLFFWEKLILVLFENFTSIDNIVLNSNKNRPLNILWNFQCPKTKLDGIRESIGHTRAAYTHTNMMIKSRNFDVCPFDLLLFALVFQLFSEAFLIYK